MSNGNGLKLLLCLLVLIQVHAPVPSWAQTPSADDSKIAVMIKALLSDVTEFDIRQEHARILLWDPQAHAPLIEAIQPGDQLTAHVIICQTIATAVDPLPDSFIPILFQGLVTEDSDLSFWAQHALARFHSKGVIKRLSAITTDPARPLSARLAALGALEIMPGKSSAQAIVRLWNAPAPELHRRVRSYLIALSGAPIDIADQQFEDDYLRRLKKLKNPTVLGRQLASSRRQLLSADIGMKDLQRRIDFWREKYFALEAANFSQLTDPTEKFEFLKHFLPSDQPEVFIWGMQRLSEWCRTPVAQTDPIDAQVVELLTPFIANPEPRVRELTAGVFELLVHKANPVTDKLIAQLGKEQYAPAQVALLKVLAALETSEAIRPALSLLDSPDPAVFTQAARSLALIAAYQAEALTKAQWNKIVVAIATTYTDHSDVPAVKSELIVAMKDIATPADNAKSACSAFHTILIAALGDDTDTVRSEAVYALTELHKHDVLPLLTSETDLLDDPATPVRHAVIAAIRIQGSKTHLERLHLRLNHEEDTDVARAIEDAFVAILARLSVEDSYRWTVQLQSASQKQPRLLNKIVILFAQQIKDAGAAGTTLDPEHVHLCLVLQGQMARRDGSIPQALAHYNRLLTLDIPNQEKDAYRREILALALVSNNGSTLLAHAVPLMPALVKDPTGTPLMQIAQACDNADPNGQNQLIVCAQIVATLIVPVLADIPSPQQQIWRIRINELALKIIDAQMEKLDAEIPQDDPAALKLLGRLDSRFEPYPADAPYAERRGVLRNFRALIQSSPPDDQPDPNQ